MLSSPLQWSHFFEIIDLVHSRTNSKPYWKKTQWRMDSPYLVRWFNVLTLKSIEWEPIQWSLPIRFALAHAHSWIIKSNPCPTIIISNPCPHMPNNIAAKPTHAHPKPMGMGMGVGVGTQCRAQLDWERTRIFSKNLHAKLYKISNPWVSLSCTPLEKIFLESEMDRNI